MNNIRKAEFCSLIAVMTIAMITSSQLSIYASPTTEDDGWTEDDYEGSPEEQKEQAQEDWEDAGRPGDNNDDEKDNSGSNNDESPSIENAPALPVQNTAVNESRWYNNCEGEGKQAGWRFTI